MEIKDTDDGLKTEPHEEEESMELIEEDEDELFREEEEDDDTPLFKIVDEYTSGAVTIDELAETYERDVKSIFELLSGANLPDDYSTRKEGNCKVFPLEKQRILVFQGMDKYSHEIRT